MICPAKLKKQTLPSAHQEKHGLGKNECTINSNVRVHSDFSPNLERYGRISNSQQERHSFSHDATFSIFSISTGTGIVTQWDCRTVTGAQKLWITQFGLSAWSSKQIMWKEASATKRKPIAVDEKYIQVAKNIDCAHAFTQSCKQPSYLSRYPREVMTSFCFSPGTWRIRIILLSEIASGKLQLIAKLGLQPCWDKNMLPSTTSLDDTSSNNMKPCAFVNIVSYSYFTDDPFPPATTLWHSEG